MDDRRLRAYWNSAYIDIDRLVCCPLKPADGSAMFVYPPVLLADRLNMPPLDREFHRSPWDRLVELRIVRRSRTKT